MPVCCFAWKRQQNLAEQHMCTEGAEPAIKVQDPNTKVIFVGDIIFQSNYDFIFSSNSILLSDFHYYIPP